MKAEFNTYKLKKKNRKKRKRKKTSLTICFKSNNFMRFTALILSVYFYKHRTKYITTSVALRFMYVIWCAHQKSTSQFNLMRSIFLCEYSLCEPIKYEWSGLRHIPLLRLYLKCLAGAIEFVPLNFPSSLWFLHPSHFPPVQLR